MPERIREDMVALLPRLRRFALTLCGSSDEADDLVQAACERALSRLNQFEPGTRLDSWMFRIVQTTWIDRTRSAARRETVTDTEVIESIPANTRLAEQTEARQSLALVRDEIAKLPEEQRAVLGLVTIDGLSYQDAANVLGVPIGTVMSRLARARKKLATAIDPQASPRLYHHGQTA
ncbi:MAG: sigma-70 family RNA polymerase sigma factor [Pseudomonadota bacterium]